MKIINTYKRILTVLLLCFNIACGWSQVKKAEPQLRHGGVTHTLPHSSDNHKTFDDVRQEADFRAAMQPKLDKPDFAFPKTVEADAEAIYREALKKGLPVAALRAAMALNVTDNVITPDSLTQALDRYRHLSHSLRPPYSAVADLLEMRLLAELYQSQSWVMEQRVLPIDQPAPNPDLWSAAQLKAEIDRLIRKVAREQDVLTVTPLSAIAPLLQQSGGDMESKLSLADFAAYRIISVLQAFPYKSADNSGYSTIPFKVTGGTLKLSEPADNPSTAKDTITGAVPVLPLPIDVIDHLIVIDSIQADRAPFPLMLARLCKLRLLNGEHRTEYADQLLGLYPVADPLRPTVLLSIATNHCFDDSTPEKQREFRALLLKTADEFPEDSVSGCLREIAEEIARPYLYVNVDGQILPAKESKLHYTIRNLPRAYVLLVKIGNNLPAERLTRKNLPANSEVRVASLIENDIPLPWEKSGDIDLPPLEKGRYAVVLSATPDLSGTFKVFNDSSLPIITVSDIAFVTSLASQNNKDFGSMVFLVRATTGEPLPGVSVKCSKTIYTQANKSKTTTETYITDKDGGFPCKWRDFTATVTPPDGAEISMPVYADRTLPQTVNRMNATILTDLAIYHPGDEVNSVAVLASINDNEIRPAGDYKLRFKLWDANHQLVAHCDTLTDADGRATVSFRLPADRLTGTYSISAGDPQNNVDYYNDFGNAWFEVAEYKAPTFKVTVDKPEMSGDTLRLTGSVMTFSGMPLADLSVNLNISYRRLWWRFIPYEGTLPSTFSTELSTDANGRFSVDLSLENIYGSPYEAGYFSTIASVTTEAGETQQSNARAFAVAEGFHTNLSDITANGADDNIVVPVNVSDAIGQTVEKILSFTISTEDGKVIDSGTFTSPRLKIPSSRLPSGRYWLQTILPDASKAFSGPDKGKLVPDTAWAYITVWRPNDKRPPFQTPLWTPETSVYASPDADSVDITVGSSYPGSRIFYQVSDTKRVLSYGFIDAGNSNKKIRVEAPADNEMVRVSLFGIHDLERAAGSVTIRPASDNRKLAIHTETFRDKIYPATPEKWKFKFNRDDMPVAGAPVMAVMSDAALNAITPFRWSMDNYDLRYYYIQGGIRLPMLHGGSTGGYTALFQPTLRNTVSLVAPSWNLWGLKLYGYGYSADNIVVTAYGAQTKESLTGSVAIMDTDKFAAVTEAVMDTGASNGSSVRMMRKSAAKAEAGSTATEETAIDDEESTDTSSRLDDLTLRDTEHPLAFFKPMLLTDNDGTVIIDFEVPDFNTTWALQLLAYDEQMRSAYLAEEIVAAKPAMITTNMPRFLLTGDRATVAATMFNNSEESLTLNGRIEIIDPVSEKVIAFSDSGDTLTEPSANATFTAEFTVPADCNALIIRSAVRSAKGYDGEQDMVQVLPSSQPVTEASTFYLTPEQEMLEMTLPEMGKEDMVTLNYCANPAWYVLTTLSGFIKPDSESTLTNLNALFSNCVAGGLIDRYQSLRSGLAELFKEQTPDSLLISPLQKNDNLKVFTLINTPWVNNAQSETARMATLQTLLDPEHGKSDINKIIDVLQANRKRDGSFSWFPQMPEGSLWITLNVLDCAARLRENGYTPKSVKFDGMVRDALRYADISMGKDFHEVVKKNKATYQLTSEISYFLNRSLLTSDPVSGQLMAMHSDMMNRLPKEWRELDILGKINAARLLKREGKGKLAREIMESVLQFASYKPEKGMWFDRLRDDLFAPSPKMVTAACIIALNELSPGDEAIMRMCQYLVLSRQTEDWNLDMSTAAVTATANAILASDLGWNDISAPHTPVISLDGRPLALPSGESLTGNITLSLTPEQASGKTLSVSRQASTPAWGGVMRQFVAPAKDVREASVPQLKVTKRLLPIENTPGGQVASNASTSFSKGNLVRVTLTLECDRDLDYVLINDRRGAFMQPADQLTRYALQNGLWILRETRDTATNFYLTRLPKGQYIITYDVYADRDGEYSTGIATAQSQYYPMITSHSAGCIVTVE